MTARPAPVRGGSSTTRSTRRGSWAMTRSTRSTVSLTRSATSRRLCRASPDRRPTGLDPPDLAAGVGQCAGEQPDAAVEVERPLARLRLQPVDHRVHQGLGGGRMDLPESVGRHPPVAAGGPFGQRGWFRARPSLEERRPSGRARGGDQLGARRPGPPGHRRRTRIGDRASLRRQRDHLVRAVRPQPGPALIVDLVAHPGPPVEPVARCSAVLTPPPPRRPSRSRPAAAAARPPPAVFSRRCAARSTCWKSQPPQSPGPAIGQRGSTRSGLGTRISTASARQKRSWLSSVIGDHHPLARQRVPDEDHPAAMAGHAVPTVRDRPDLDRADRARCGQLSRSARRRAFSLAVSRSIRSSALPEDARW